MVTNTSTGETIPIADAAQRYPELGISLSNFDSQPTTPSGEVNEEELDNLKKKLGFKDMMKRQVEKRMTQLNEKLGKLKSPTEEPDGSVKVKTKKKTYQHMSDLREMQALTKHSGPVWNFAVSHDGVFLASGGRDSIVRVWVVVNSSEGKEHSKTVASQISHEEQKQIDQGAIFHPIPYRVYSGHKADVIDLDWSKARFLLSASIDKTVRLWHMSREKCLCIFQHPDFVTSVMFHPKEDRFFLSGSFDKKLRVWNIPEHRVVEWQLAANVITAAAFSPNGDLAVAGLYDGCVVFYNADSFKYIDQVDCRNRHGKHRKGKKVTGLVFSADGTKLLITTNDSRIRLLDVNTRTVLAKLKGNLNEELQIRASFGEGDTSVICGSEDQQVYVWTGLHNADGSVINRNEAYESFKASSKLVTCAQFCPRVLINQLSTTPKPKHLILSSGFSGEIKVFQNLGDRVLR